MMWKKWLSYDPYKKLWFWAKRPFTYIIRDSWASFEYLWILGLILLGNWLGHNFGWKEVMERVLWLTAGFLLGHLFWGTRHIAGQKEVEKNAKRKRTNRRLRV